MCHLEKGLMNLVPFQENKSSLTETKFEKCVSLISQYKFCSEEFMENNKNYSWYSVQGPGSMAQTPQADIGDSVSRFRRYHCSTVINCDSYFPVGEQCCLQLLFTT